MDQNNPLPDDSQPVSTLLTQKIIAIIPARGGSKGIPRKNIVPINGIPLIAYSINHALATPGIQRVIVSTDDPDIMSVAVDFQAEVFHRPNSISGDHASSESALSHVLDHLIEKEDYHPDLVVFLQATSPIRQTDDLTRALHTFFENNLDSLFSACAVEGFTWRVSSEKLSPVNYDPTHRPMRQDLVEHVIEENGSFYIFKPWVIQRYNSRLGGIIGYHLMDRLSSFQVDRPQDVANIQVILEILKKLGGLHD